MSDKKKTYVLYGASFNPPHQGHFSAINQMLEIYDYVIIFLYPQKHNNESGVIEFLPPIKQREKMLDIFIKEHFPQMQERLLITNLAEKLGQQKSADVIIHTYDYLQFVKRNIPTNSELCVCLGFEAQNYMRAEKFFKQEEIETEFGIFFLEEENKIQSKVLRDFFSNNKNIKSVKDMNYIKYAVGNGLANYIFENNLYGLKDKIKKSKEKTNIDKESLNIELDQQILIPTDENIIDNIITKKPKRKM